MTETLNSNPKPLLAESRPGTAALIAVAVFFTGGVLGEMIANWSAPESGVIAIFSFLALPAAFMVSLVLWQGFTFIVLLAKLLAGGRKAAMGRRALDALTARAWLLVPLPVIFMSVAGLVAGVLGNHGFIISVFTYFALGTAYGVGCYWLGRTGRLPLLGE